MKYNFYCDESGHLQYDQVPVMVLGTVWCETVKAKEIASRLREIKVKHGLSTTFEVKWTKVSPAKAEFYLNWLDYFFNEEYLNFRALVIQDKSQLDHDRFAQDHDTWYYKMYYQLLVNVINPQAENYIYLDIKDTRGGAKVSKLWEVLATAKFDNARRVIRNIQQINSLQVQQAQLVDLLIGAVSYANRGLSGNSAKVALVRKLQEKSGHSLTQSTALREQKANIFIWRPS